MFKLTSLIKQPAVKVFYYFIIIFTFIAPGSVLIFLYYNDLFLKLDTVRLLLLSSFIVFPFFTVNLTGKSTFLIIEKRFPYSPDPGLSLLASAATDTSLVFYAVIFGKWFFNFDFTLKDVFICLVLGHIIFLVYDICNNLILLKRRN